MERKYEEFSDCEVERVLNHRVYNDKFSFLVKFRGFRDPEWVSDDDCNCEGLIREYMIENVPETKTFYGISRVSSKSQIGPTHVSLMAQEVKIRESIDQFKNAFQMTRIKMYNITSSAYKGVPTQLKQVAEHSQNGDIVVIYRVDRLSRNIVRFLGLLEDMNDKGVSIYSQSENLWYHNQKLDFLQHILNANRESQNISKRVKLSVGYRKRRGDYIGSAPYGFKLSRNPNTQSVAKIWDPEEQQVIRMIKENVGNLSARMLADKLNEKKLYKRGKAWNPAMIRYIRKKI